MIARGIRWLSNKAECMVCDQLDSGSGRTVREINEGIAKAVHRQREVSVQAVEALRTSEPIDPYPGSRREAGDAGAQVVW